MKNQTVAVYVDVHVIYEFEIYEFEIYTLCEGEIFFIGHCRRIFMNCPAEYNKVIL